MALREDREIRYQSAGEMRADLDAILTQPVVKVEADADTAPATLPPQARPQRPGGQPVRPTLRSATPPPPKKSRSGLILAGLAVLAALALGAFFLFRPQAPPRSAQTGAPVSSTPPAVGAGVGAPAAAGPPAVAGEIVPARGDTRPIPGATLATATKDLPFVNSLGMTFVPVPILGGPTGGQRVLFSVWDTRVQDYDPFIRETNRTWPKAAFEQGPTHPAVNVGWDNAQHFCEWLTARDQAAGLLPENWRYRLPSDHEWSCAVGIGVREDAAKLPADKDQKLSDAFPWGAQWPPPKGAGNFAGEESRPALDARKNVTAVIPGYDDGFVNTSPVASFKANQFGLFDMGGNVMQICEDWFEKEQRQRVIRGAAWYHGERRQLLLSLRGHIEPGDGDLYNAHGFRCVAGMAAPP
jgi:hypothetical protein